MSENLAVIIHGGAGKLSIDHASKKLPFLKEARDAAWDAVAKGKPADIAVVEAIRVLEACEYFNAGYGGYPNINGIVLTDVGLMRGNLDFVSLVHCRRLKFPSAVALDMLTPNRTLMTTWTRELELNLEQAPDFIKEKYGLVKTHEDLIAPHVRRLMELKQAEVEQKVDDIHGTVGCVVRDINGHIAAGTSTGGLSFKYNGRIGDTPVVGSGVYADDNICGLSTTGHGETFLKTLVSGFVISEMRSALRKDKKVFSDSKLLRQLLDDEFKEVAQKSPGRGAMIVIPPIGKPVYSFNSEMVSVGYKYGSADKIEGEDYLIDCIGRSPIREG
ncbi:MAG: isoaspartyl peptidase/L-asparaginase [Deltaproteobacteria bacterium]|nr:isoaspartyl peptidase/L-asparaginase [Deltaproteobacteria bacterium]